MLPDLVPCSVATYWVGTAAILQEPCKDLSFLPAQFLPLHPRDLLKVIYLALSGSKIQTGCTGFLQLLEQIAISWVL